MIFYKIKLYYQKFNYARYIAMYDTKYERNRERDTKYERNREHETKMSKVSKMIQIQSWNNYSKEEKKKYQLHKHIKERCELYNLPDNLIDKISNVVYKILILIEEVCDGVKRGKVKDGIILTSIRYVCYLEHFELNEAVVENNLLDKKYISKANKMIMELVNLNKLQLYDFNNYIHSYTQEKQYHLSNKQDAQNHEKLVQYCHETDLLLEHSEKMIRIACLYYILYMKGESLNTNNTIYRILQKLILHKDKLNPIIQTPSL